MRSVTLAALCVLVLIGCAPGRARVRGDAVRRLTFEGNGGFFSGHNDLQLQLVMSQKRSPRFAFTFPVDRFATPVTLDPVALAADVGAIEVWYAHHGWFDARFLGWKIRRVREAGSENAQLQHSFLPGDYFAGPDIKGRFRATSLAGVVDVVGVVEPGRRSTVRQVEILGFDGLGAVGRLLLAEAKRRSGVAEGDQFSLDEVDAGVAAMTAALKEKGYAFAKVQADMDAFPEEGAVDLTFEVELGPRLPFGTISVFGADRVPEFRARQVLRFSDTKGKPLQFSLTALRKNQQALFNTGLYSLVSIEPDLSDPTVPAVPVRIELTESKSRRVRLGAALEYDLFTVTPQLQAEFRDANVGGSLMQLEIAAAFGALVGVLADDDGQPVTLTGMVGVRGDYPWALKRKLALTGGATFQQDVQFGSIPYRSLEADLALAYKPGEHISLGIGPAFEYFDYLNFNNTSTNAGRLQFGGDFSGGTYRLLSLDMRYVGDWRDDALRTRRGSLWRAELRQSLPLPGFRLGESADYAQRGYLYTRADGEVRLYRPFRLSKRQGTFPFVGMGRLAGTLILPWDSLFPRGWDGGQVPYVDLGFLGGPSSLRGFRTNQVGPYDCVCTYANAVSPPHNNGQNTGVARTYLPHGGVVSLEAAAEVRWDWVYGISLAMFGDVGILSRQWTDLGLEDLRYGGGVGVRYDSLIGPVRFDLGFRPLFAEDAGPANAFGCLPADRLARPFDLMSSSRNVRFNVLERHPPLAINLFFAIGQAF